MREALELGRQLTVLLLHVELLERLRNERLETIQLISGEWLLDVIVGAFAHCLHRGIDCRLTGYDDALRRNRAQLELLEQREPIHLRHFEISEHDTKGPGA